MAGTTLGFGGVSVNPFLVPQFAGQTLQPTATLGQYSTQPLQQIQQLLQIVPQQLQQVQQLQYLQQYHLQQLQQILQVIPAQLAQLQHIVPLAQTGQQPFTSSGMPALPLWSASPQMGLPNYVM